MKKTFLFNIVLGVCATFALSSCELLDLIPKDKITPDNYFVNENQLELYTNRFYYDVLPSGASVFKEVGDNLIWTPLAQEISGQRTVPQSGGSWTFTTLRHINFLLENADNCPDKDAVNKYTAVAKFFRAYFYFEKVKRFGDVPWVDHVPLGDDPVLYKPRDSREAVMDNIIRDLDDALAALEKTKSKKEVYRVNYWTVLALKSRAMLFEGTFRKYHGLDNWKKYLEECCEASWELINDGGYSLYDTGTQPYRDLFIQKNAPAREVILARDYDEGLLLSNDVCAVINTPGQGRVGFTRKFINTYLNADGTRFTDKAGYKTMEFKDEMKGRDPRLLQTVRSGSELYPTACITCYQPIKYVEQDNFTTQEKTYCDLSIFRLAEIYLNVAEAEAELGTLDQDMLDKTVNKLRDRVGMTAAHLNMTEANASPDPYLTSPATGYVNVTGQNAGVILEIRRERSIELVLESQWRYYDLMRWKEGQCITQKFEGIYIPSTAFGKAYDINQDGKDDICVHYENEKPEAGAVTYVPVSKDKSGTYLSNGSYGTLVFFEQLGREWNEERDYLYPVPLDEIIYTDGAIKQNPGWGN